MLRTWSLYPYISHDHTGYTSNAISAKQSTNVSLPDSNILRISFFIRISRRPTTVIKTLSQRPSVPDPLADIKARHVNKEAKGRDGDGADKKDPNLRVSRKLDGFGGIILFEVKEIHAEEALLHSKRRKTLVSCAVIL